MDSQGSPLCKAVQLYIAGACTEEAGSRIASVMECLEGDDWEAALILLEDLGDAHPQPSEFWGLLVEAARLLWLEKDAEWYGWRGYEAQNGAIWAELRLLSTEGGGRLAPLPPRGRYESFWDIGRRTPEGKLAVNFAFLWVEGNHPIQPGGCVPVRLLPLTPEHWRYLNPGDVIMMHEGWPPVGVARVTEVMPPVDATCVSAHHHAGVGRADPA
ncbi:hypothetical protein ACFY19_15475 [Streptosporangium saharense]|uniref:hypothetical protein n=1 Tax=Streptosporangium saharense TaxID=1706840 RepID=UPI0036B57FC8